MTIECRYGTLAWSFSTGYLHTCVVENSEVFANSRIFVDSIWENHENTIPSDDIEAITIGVNSHVKYFPRNLHHLFENLEVIQIYNSSLQEITENDLNGFNQLQYLLLGHNRIKTLGENLFQHNRQLKLIWLNGNQINNIHPNTFDGLTDLERLDLGDNSCRSSWCYAETRSEVLTIVNGIMAGECSPDEIRTNTRRNHDEHEKLRAKNEELKDKLSQRSDYIQQLLKEIEAAKLKAKTQSEYIKLLLLEPEDQNS